MNYDQAVVVLQTIRELYPDKFKITKTKAEVIIPQLEKMEFELVKKKLSEYAGKYPFPPTLADIAVYPPRENPHLEKIKKWDQEAEGVSDETKQLLQEKLEELIRKVSK
ncbi:hypothetical protein GCM10010954_15970 [Halobacillus andaensis]|uniref:Replicative helicase inhibitor G39P N-terminal domain-containing protein n=1 Tax=Halobacillus andaensis TaxID=1176239 RepID=A0A917B2V9_HALAA|nr:hypothetical protein [Halobacillus andaensis]MBP2004903.1 hypothetical protein [Halobacillus andaensis]GGF17996.1 hypothetical protein GCM10010954_15970 [Halobacillus andaensis]